MQLFYAPDIHSNHYTLSKEESMHCVKVLRMKEGDTLFLTDGIGQLYKTVITFANAKACTVEVVETTTETPLPYALHMAVAPTKNIARFEWFLEKAVEIGINEITPLICEHSERMHLNTERLNKILLSAMKQSLKTYLPVLNEPIRYLDFLKKDFEGQKLIAYCEGSERNPVNTVYTKGNNCLMVIGPEGDFSLKEIEQSLKNGFSPITLGQSRLRTETAALASCVAIHLLNDF